MNKTFSIAALVLLLGVAPCVAQTTNSAGDASNSQQNGENHQTSSGGQSGGAAGRQ